VYHVRAARPQEWSAHGADSGRCLHIYFYVIDPEFGFMHVRVQTWIPYTVQVYVNGREWLTRQVEDLLLRVHAMSGPLRDVQAFSSRHDDRGGPPSHGWFEWGIS
jgi:hypothetical protein